MALVAFGSARCWYWNFALISAVVPRWRIAVGGVAASGSPRAVARGAGRLAGRARGGVPGRAPPRSDRGRGRVRHGQRGQLARRPALHFRDRFHVAVRRETEESLPVRVRAPAVGPRSGRLPTASPHQPFPTRGTLQCVRNAPRPLPLPGRVVTNREWTSDWLTEVVQ